MQKVEAQRNQAPQQAAQRQGGGAALESPQGEQIAQLEATVETSPRVDGVAHIADMANSGPQAAAQRRMIDMIDNSPRMDAQRKAADAAQNIQRTDDAPAKPNNTGLPDNLKSGIESLSGISVDNVKVHYNSSQPAQLNALAYAQGTDIHVAPGQERHLPHEAWHVVQQAQGRVRPTMQMKEATTNDDSETEADVMGARTFSLETVQAKQSSESAGQAIQRMVVYGDKDVTHVDKIVAANIAWDHNKVGGDLISLSDIDKNEEGTYTIQPGEIVMVEGHGGAGKVNGLTSVAFAEILKKIGGIHKADFILVNTCSSGAETKKDKQDSVVDITYQVLKGMVTVAGSPGTSIYDYSKVTGAYKTYYKVDTTKYASAIERCLQYYLGQADLRDPLNLDNLQKIKEYGEQLLQNEQYMTFYDELIGTLAGTSKRAEEYKLALTNALSSDEKPKWYQDLVKGMAKYYFGQAEDYAKHYVEQAIVGLEILSNSGEAFVSLATSGEYALVAKKQGSMHPANLVDKE